LKGLVVKRLSKPPAFLFLRPQDLPHEATATLGQLEQVLSLLVRVP